MTLSVFSRHSSKSVVVAALGAGVLIGSGVTWWLFGRRLTDAVQRLTQQISELRHEIDRLRMYVEERVLPIDFQRNNLTDFVDDDEDVYEDAYDGWESLL